MTTIIQNGHLECGLGDLELVETHNEPRYPGEPRTRRNAAWVCQRCWYALDILTGRETTLCVAPTTQEDLTATPAPLSHFGDIEYYIYDEREYATRWIVTVGKSAIEGVAPNRVIADAQARKAVAYLIGAMRHLTPDEVWLQTIDRLVTDTPTQARTAPQK